MHACAALSLSAGHGPPHLEPNHPNAGQPSKHLCMHIVLAAICCRRAPDGQVFHQLQQLGRGAGRWQGGVVGGCEGGWAQRVRREPRAREAHTRLWQHSVPHLVFEHLAGSSQHKHEWHLHGVVGWGERRGRRSNRATHGACLHAGCARPCSSARLDAPPRPPHAAHRRALLAGQRRVQRGCPPDLRGVCGGGRHTSGSSRVVAEGTAQGAAAHGRTPTHAPGGIEGT